MAGYKPEVSTRPFDEDELTEADIAIGTPAAITLQAFYRGAYVRKRIYDHLDRAIAVPDLERASGLGSRIGDMPDAFEIALLGSWRLAQNASVEESHHPSLCHRIPVEKHWVAPICNKTERDIRQYPNVIEEGDCGLRIAHCIRLHRSLE